MSGIEDYGDVLPDNLRRVWAHVADCARRVGGVLMGGTAVAMHLRHRMSEDLDVMTLRSFSGSAIHKRLELAAASVDVIEVSDNMFHGYVDGVKVDVFRALPTNSVKPSSMRWIGPKTPVSGMNVGSLPDLMATKLDVIMYRAKLRDYIDLAELDRSGACSLEAGLGYYCRRYGYSHPPQVLEQIIGLLGSPGTVPTDPGYEEMRDDSLDHLQRRTPALLERLADLRDMTIDAIESQSARSPAPKMRFGLEPPP